MLCKKEEYRTLNKFNEDWIGELKYDGSRIVAVVKKDSVKLYTRKGNEVSQKFPELDFENVEEGVYDGEIITKGGFNNTLKRVNTENKNRIEIMSKKIPSTYVVFDILKKDNSDTPQRNSNLRHIDLIERKKILDMCIENGNNIKKIEYTEDIKELWNKVKKEGKEGIIVKKKDSKYREGKRSNKWLKLKTIQVDTFKIVGFKKSKKRSIRSFILADEKGNYVGNVGSGFTESELDRFKEAFGDIVTNEPYFEEENDYGKGEVVWIDTPIDVEIEYQEKNDKLRHPTFQKVL